MLLNNARAKNGTYLIDPDGNGPADAFEVFHSSAFFQSSKLQAIRCCLCGKCCAQFCVSILAH